MMSLMTRRQFSVIKNNLSCLLWKYKTKVKIFFIECKLRQYHVPLVSSHSILFSVRLNALNMMTLWIQWRWWNQWMTTSHQTSDNLTTAPLTITSDCCWRRIYRGRTVIALITARSSSWTALKPLAQIHWSSTTLRRMQSVANWSWQPRNYFPIVSNRNRLRPICRLMMSIIANWLR